MSEGMMMFSKRFAALVSLLVLAGCMNTAGSIRFDDPMVPDPDFDPELGVDIPTWRVGDHWNYSTSFTVSYLGFNIPVSGWMNMSTALITLDFSYSDSPVYITDITGNLTGRLYIPLLGIDETIYVNLTGYIWERIQDLSMYRLVVNASVTGTLTALNGYYPFGYEYSPPLEQYDFPLVPEEEWKVNVSARAPFGASGDLVNFQENLSCGDPVPVVVPAGSFICYPIAEEDVPVLYYNRTVGNTVERIFDLNIQGVQLTIPWKLREYERAPEETRIRLWIGSEQPVMAGETFQIKGELNTGNTIVTVFFPGGRIAATIPLAGPQLSFNRDLTAPMYMDDTPTGFDHGSFGILAVVGTLDEYDVCTVTTKALDLMVNESSLTISHTNEGTKDDDFTAGVVIYNTLNYGIDEFSFVILNTTGAEVYSDLVEGLQAHENHRISVPLGKLAPGDHSLELFVDHLMQIDEYNETNNAVKVNFTVKERPSLFVNSSLEPGDITMKEGEWFNITANSYRGGEAMDVWNWTLDGVLVDSDQHLNLTLGFLGELSSRDTPYIVGYSTDPSFLYEGENGTLIWNLTVLNVNREPVLLSFAPTNQTVVLMESEGVELSLELFDPDLTVPMVEWIVDGEPAAPGSYPGHSIFFNSTYIGSNSSEGSPYFVEARIRDPEDPMVNLTHNWTIRVMDLDREPSINVLPSPGDITIMHNGTLEFQVYAEDPDNDPATVGWFIEGNEMSEGMNFSFDPIALDLSREDMVGLKVVITVGSFQYEYNWTIVILKPVQPEEPEPVPPAGVVITLPISGTRFHTNDTVTFKAVHVDARPLLFVWYINGSFYEGDEVSLSGFAPGSYIAVLNVSTEGPPPGWIELTVDFTVVVPDDRIVEPEDGEDDPFPWWLLLIGILGLIGIAGLIFLALNRGKDKWAEE
ncbi:MAG: hypothetical protein ACMUHY_02740 [Thermoplasmatota archaeon]